MRVRDDETCEAEFVEAECVFLAGRGGLAEDREFLEGGWGGGARRLDGWEELREGLDRAVQGECIGVWGADREVEDCVGWCVDGDVEVIDW